MLGKIISALVTLYLIVGIVYAIIWGYVPAIFTSAVALDANGFFMSILRSIVAMITWIFILNGRFAITF